MDVQSTGELIESFCTGDLNRDSESGHNGKAGLAICLYNQPALYETMLQAVRGVPAEKATNDLVQAG